MMNNNNHDNLYGAVIMAEPLREFTRPPTQDQPDDLGCEFACTGCQKLHPPSPLLLLLSPQADTYFTVPQKL